MTKRSGVVAAAQPDRGMFALETEDDGYTLIEVLHDFKLEIGDLMMWENGHGLGFQRYANVTKGAREEVYVQFHSLNNAGLKQHFRP
ncbi:MAG TPA: hypothetical protein VGM81_20225 [Burkholderiaceae bacterium]|jgi:hypothetical protein